MLIEREPTLDERKDFRVLSENHETISDRFSKLVNAKEQECTKNKVPFCRRCAKLDFMKLFKDRIDRAEESGEFYSNEKELKIEMPDLEEYTKLSRFEFLGEREELNPANSFKGTKAEMHKCKVFQCKERKCNISIFFTEEELNNANVSNMQKQSPKKK